MTASATGRTGSYGWPTTSAGTVIRRRSFDDGAARPKNSPCSSAAMAPARWSQRVERDPGPERYDAARDRPGEPAQQSDGQRQEAGREQQRAEHEDAGLDAVVEDRRVHDEPADPLRGDRGGLQRHVGAQRRSADHGLGRTEVVEERDDLLGELGHRVGMRVGGPVGAAVPERVEGHHVQALGRQRVRQGLLHPSGRELGGQQHDPRVARAVLGVLEPVAAGVRLDEELPDLLRHQHGLHPRVWAMSISARDQVSWPVAGFLLLGIAVAGVAAVELAPAGSPAASWWPAAGLAVILLGLAPRSWWWSLVPGIVVASVIANLIGDRPVALSCCYAVANAAEAVVAASVLRRGGRPTLPELSTVEEFVRLLGAAVLAGLTIATMAAAAAAALDDASFELTWRAVFASHTASVLVILPLVMAPTTRGPRRPVWELPLQVGALAIVTLLVFSPNQTLSLEFIPLPLLIWAALRFDVRLVAWEVVAFAIVVTLLSSEGYGTFAFDTRRGELSAFGMGAIVQAYVVVAVLMTLPLAIGAEQRRTTERLFRRNFTESVVGMLLMRSRGGRPFEIIDANDAAGRLLPADSRGRNLDEVLETGEPLELIAARLVAGNLDGWKAQTGVRGRPGTRVEVAVSLLTTEPTPTYAAQLLDVTTESEARRQLEAAEKLTSATLDTTAAMILVTDLRGVVVRVNGATTALTGFGEDELVGVEVWSLPIASAGSTGYPAGLPEDVHSQVSRETDVVTKSGQRRRVLWNTGYVLDDKDRPTYVVITGTDLTAERTVAGLNRHLLEAAITTALIGIDHRGRITVFNAGAVNLLGYDAQDTVGTPFVDLLDPEELAARCDGATGEAAFERLVAGLEGGSETGLRDWTWLGSDGRRHTVSMTVSVAADTFASRVGYLCVGRDVTEARTSQEMLIAALEKERLAVQRMREVDTAKNEFVSTVSHELRTPVTSIVGYTEMLADGSLVPPAAEQRPLLESIERNGRRLILLCNDLLMLSGLDSGAAHWERGQVDLAELVAGTGDTLAPQLTGRDLELVVDSPVERVAVLGDRGQLERVLINLVGNAIKFTEDGGRIEVGLEARDGQAWLTVSDTGIGIPLDEQPSLFQRFFRSSTAQQRAIQGTGLGLSIVAAILAAHGGRIDVDSAHLEGTTFTVRLPLAR